MAAHPATVAQARALIEDAGACDYFVDAWRRRFRAVGDRALRRRVLLECVDQADDAALIVVLHRLEARALAGEADARWMLSELALSPGALGDLPYARRADLYACAREAGLGRIAARFLGHDSTGGTGDDEARAAALRAALGEDAEPAGTAPTVNPQFEAAPGLRIAAARGTRREALDRLMHDRDVRVIAALLDNPRIIERDVVRIAAMRPTSTGILERIAAHPRWSARTMVRKALAFNPCTPRPLARQLLPTLLRQDLELLAGSHVLAEPLRHEARLLLSRRARRG